MNKFFYGIASTGMICLFIGFGSCSKEGIIGPQGEPGEQGIAGIDGSTIHNGTGVPAGTIGKSGDYYLDKSNTDLYGPKTDSGWGSPLNLKGAKGDNGAAGQDGTPGSQFHSGNGMPQASIGHVGDFYFDKDNVSLYGPKIASGWGSPVSLKAANDSGVKIVVLKNHQFQDLVVREIDDWGSSGSMRSYLIPVPDYEDYYEQGAVLAYTRLSSDADGNWETLVSEPEGVMRSYQEGVIRSLYYTEFKFGKKSISVTSEYEATDGIDINESFTNFVLSNFLIDFKFVLIPGTQVSAMVNQGVNIHNTVAVADFLKL